MKSPHPVSRTRRRRKAVFTGNCVILKEGEIGEDSQNRGRVRPKRRSSWQNQVPDRSLGPSGRLLDDMNGIRVELIFNGEVPQLSFACISQRTEASVMIVIAEDTPGLRAKLVEVLLAHPETKVAAIRCSLALPEEFRTPHELVGVLLDGIAEGPLSYNIKSAARRLGISYSYMRELIHLGRIKKVAGRISEAEIRRFLTARRAD